MIGLRKILYFCLLSIVYQISSADENRCYGLSQIGKDSVINHHAGTPPEHAERIARNEDGTYNLELYNIIVRAYLWEGTAEEYQLKIMFDCLGKEK